MISSQVHESAAVVGLKAEGDVTHEEMLASVQQVFSDPSWSPGMNWLIDLRHARMDDVSSDILRRLASEVARHLPKDVEIRTAILASEDANFGLARMYEAYTRRTPERVFVSRDAGEALDWIGAPLAILAEAEAASYGHHQGSSHGDATSPREPA